VRRLVISSLACAMALGVAACQPIENPGRTDKIEFVSTSTVNGWKYEYFRNTAYPCSISGYQTFVIGTKLGSSDTAQRPLWVHMHGGGVGFFHANGLGEQAKRCGHPFSVVLFDIDRFKQYNDTAGHGAGDEVLRSVAAMLSQQCRSGDAAYR